jgi:hypothetical protein
MPMIVSRTSSPVNEIKIYQKQSKKIGRSNADDRHIPALLHLP